ncbi:MAG TPA: hypothetical protein VN648_00115 [Candidatus Methylomirabilis sp.]|nr:hypothetical protein [Candidatus Methylomirabilis sp.]
MDEPTAPNPRLPWRLFRWGGEHPATVFWGSVAAILLTMLGVDALRLPDALGVACLVPLAAIAVVSYVYGILGLCRRGPVRTRLLRGLSLLGLPALMVMIALPYLKMAPRRPPVARAASEVKTAVTQAIVYAKDKGTYPTNLKALRENGYANVADNDPWGKPYILSPVLQQGAVPRVGDDVYVYSKGPQGMGTYPRPFTPESAKGGSIGFSSLYGSWQGG